MSAPVTKELTAQQKIRFWQNRCIVFVGYSLLALALLGMTYDLFPGSREDQSDVALVLLVMFVVALIFWAVRELPDEKNIWNAARTKKAYRAFLWGANRAAIPYLLGGAGIAALVYFYGDASPVFAHTELGSPGYSLAEFLALMSPVFLGLTVGMLAQCLAHLMIFRPPTDSLNSSLDGEEGSVR